MNNLSKLKCSACNADTPKLTENEINNNLKKINKWVLNYDKNMISKKFIFKNFKKALSFTNFIGQICEEEKHHADIALGYGYVLIMIHTHATKSLTINDFILASKIDGIDK